MKIKILLGAFLLLSLTSCKTKFSISDDDNVLFVLFEPSKSMGTRNDSSHQKNKMQMYWFEINAYVHYSDQIILRYKTYQDFDELERNNPVPKFHVDRRFIKNNKPRILTLEKMKEMGYQETLVLFKKTKHVFLIDEKESMENLLSIKEVFLFDIGEE
ncbi:hypothetical protein LRR18_05880 [Mangrovimonas sp. AS39]|uniref:hypothetical protein n=1 Tax=Mangrovimonas futianensis TaxID=2895523 RepID=UPI001E3AB02F|nr:hypothetical protein [Mangrovimonas futianensis]MCF1191108.1 hypothetical protein [Mangrovimonas futianensis]MCF1194803.1 hypothetical protein [Mangrovimonas futianensis]